MKLAAKLVLIFMLGVFAIVGLFSWQMVRRQQRWAEALRKAHETDLFPLLSKAYREGGTIQVQRAIEVSARRLTGKGLRWVEPSDPPTGNSDADTQIQSRQTLTVTIAGNNGSAARTTIPLVIDGDRTEANDLLEPTVDYEESFWTALGVSSLVSILGVALLSALVIFVGGVRLVGRPLDRLVAQVEQIGNGKLDLSPVLSSNDELGRLAAAISKMSHRLSEQMEAITRETEARVDAEQQLRHADRLTTVGTLAAGLAHELGTPLNVVCGRAELIAGQKLSPDEVKQSAKTIKSEGERMTRIIRQLLDFARRRPSAPEVLNLAEITWTTIDLLRPIAAKKQLEISFESGGPETQVMGDSAQLQQVITNLLSNAIQASSANSVIRLTLSKSSQNAPTGVKASPAGFICLSITDRGVGIPPEQIERIFEPFFTTKDVGEGTGLGLSIAYGIVREHGGWIAARSQPLVGTTFDVYLPKIA